MALDFSIFGGGTTGSVATTTSTTTFGLFGTSSLTPLGGLSSGNALGTTGGGIFGGGTTTGTTTTTTSSSSFGLFGPSNGIFGGGFGFGCNTGGTGGLLSGIPTSAPVQQVGPQGIDVTSVQLNEGDTSGYNFQITDFAVVSGEALHSLKIISLPENGSLQLSGSSVAVNQSVPLGSFDDLTYIADTDFDGVDTFKIAMSTDGAVYDSTPSSVSITILNTNDAPSVNSISTIGVEEGMAASGVGAAIVGAFTDVDSTDTLGSVALTAIPSSTNGQLTYTSDAGGTIIVTSTGGELTAAEAATLVFTAATDIVSSGATTSETISFTVKDNQGLAGSNAGSVSIQITDGNDAPTLSTSSSFSVDEGTLAVSGLGTHYGDDEETPNTLVYSISGIDAGDFTINQITGELGFSSRPDFEDPKDSNLDNEYVINLVVTDDQGETATQEITIDVDDLSTPPVIDSGTTATVDEGVSAAYTATVSDTGVGDSVTYSLSGGADVALFNINPTSGAVTFKTASDAENPADTDTNGTYVFEVTATDEDGNTDAETVTITVDDIDDENPDVAVDGVAGAIVAPAVLVSAAPGSIEVTVGEDFSGGFFDLAYDDGETTGASVVTYALTSSAPSSISVASSTGVLSVSGNLDFETKATETIKLTITDDSGAVATTQVKLNVTDKNEGPEAEAIALQSVDSDDSIDFGALIEDSFSDPEGDDLTFDITSAPTSADTEGVLKYRLGGFSGATTSITAVPANGLSLEEISSLEYFGPETTEAGSGSISTHISGSITITATGSPAATVGPTSASINLDYIVIDVA